MVNSVFNFFVVVILILLKVRKENKELRDRVENLEKEGRMRLLARSVGQNHSRDSAIDTDLQVYTIEEIQL